MPYFGLSSSDKFQRGTAGEITNRANCSWEPERTPGSRLGGRKIILGEDNFPAQMAGLKLPSARTAESSYDAEE